MGFQRRTYKLIFDGVYEGLEVRTRGASIGEHVEMTRLTSSGGDLLDADHEPERLRLLDLLAGKILDWNLTDDVDQPVPCTAEQLGKEDLWMVLAITRAWLEAGAGVAHPLANGSDGGAQVAPLELSSLPMEAL